MKYFLLFLFLISAPMAMAQSEREYADAFCETMQGKRTDYRNNQGKLIAQVDCLTERYAIEVDKAYNWQECIGQAAHYAMLTGRQPACALIVKKGDARFVKRLRKVAAALCVAVNSQCHKLSIFLIRR